MKNYHVYRLGTCCLHNQLNDVYRMIHTIAVRTWFTR